MKKLLILVIAFLFIVFIVGVLSASEPETVRPTITSWELYKKWSQESEQLFGSTQEIPIPKNAVAWKIVVYWEGTSPALKGYGRLVIQPGKLVDAGAHNKIVYLRDEELDVKRSLLDSPGSTKISMYIEEDALYYFVELDKTTGIGDCVIEVYFGY